MALPAVLLKAKGALKKAGKAKAVADSLKSNKNEQSDEGTKFPVGCILCAPLGCLFIPLLLIMFMILIFTDIFGTEQQAEASQSRSGSSNVAVGEAAGIEGENERIEYLYDGNGVPQTEEENESYLETFDIEYLSEDGSVQTFSLTMHKKLKAEVQAIFQELIDIDFKIEWKSGGGSIRGWNADTGYVGNFFRSAHCYGHAVDINVAANPCAQCGVGAESDYQPGVNEYSVTPEVVEIWKKHGFYWGGDWTSPKDYMHFSYFDH